MKKFAEHKGDEAYTDYLEEEQKKLRKTMEALCWDEDRFIRGFTEEGAVIGKRTDKEANIWLNPQSWSVISRFASQEQADTALDTVYQRLNTEYGVILMDPPYHTDAFEGALAVIYNAGTKENAGIFSQSQGWIILAEALQGHGDRAFIYFYGECTGSPERQGTDPKTGAFTAMGSLQRGRTVRILAALMYIGLQGQHLPLW